MNKGVYFVQMYKDGRIHQVFLTRMLEEPRIKKHILSTNRKLLGVYCFGNSVKDVIEKAQEMREKWVEDNKNLF